jgi:hypothetical protein
VRNTWASEQMNEQMKTMNIALKRRSQSLSRM